MIHKDLTSPDYWTGSLGVEELETEIYVTKTGTKTLCNKTLDSNTCSFSGIAIKYKVNDEIKTAWLYLYCYLDSLQLLANQYVYVDPSTATIASLLLFRFTTAARGSTCRFVSIEDFRHYEQLRDDSGIQKKSE